MVNIILGMLVAAFFIMITIFAIYTWMVAWQDRDWMSLALAVIVTLMALLPVAYIIDSHQKDIATQDTQIVEVEVVDKVYHPSTTRIIIVDKTTIITPVAAKHLVTISSEQHIHTFNNESMYTSFQLGDKFEVELISYISKAGKVFDKEFKFLNQTP